MNRKVLWPILLIGAALVAAPFALSLPTKATAGERMIRDFQPIMQADAVQETARYYDEVFVPLGKVAPLMGEATVAKFSGYLEGFAGVQADAERLVPLLAGALGLTPAEVAMLAREPARLAGIDVRLFLSHLACADEPHHPLNPKQLALFIAAKSRLAGGGVAASIVV